MKNIKIKEISVKNYQSKYSPYGEIDSELELEVIRIKGKLNGLDMSILNYWDKSSNCRRSILTQDQILIELAESIKKNFDPTHLTSDQKLDALYQHHILGLKDPTQEH